MSGMRQQLIEKLVVERECWSDPRPPNGRQSGATTRNARPALAREAAEDVLAATLTGEIIPRLVEARRRQSPAALAAPPVTAEHVEALVAFALAEDPDGVMGFVERSHARGVPFESICLDALAPAARRLGDLWCDDRCDFTQVTLGTLRLTRALQGLSELNPMLPGPRAPRALFVSVPGEQHGFGVSMLVAFFRHSGWDAEFGTPATVAELAHSVRARNYRIAGISAACDRSLDTVAASVRAVRASSCQPAIAILVGGRVFHDQPALAERIGADCVTGDVREALRMADRFAARDTRHAG